MKNLLFVVSLFLYSHLFSQTSIVYQRNAITGNIEAFESSYGIPKGKPLYEITRNAFGYLEIKSLNNSVEIPSSTLNPYTRRPTYIITQGYNLPYKAALDQLNTLNRRFEENLNYERKISDENFKSSVAQMVNKSDEDARNLLSLYQSFTTFPETIKDGWHKVYSIFNSPLQEGKLAISNSIVFVQSNQIKKKFLIGDDQTETTVACNTPIEIADNINKERVIFDGLAQVLMKSYISLMNV